jgi:hypothetical protein
MDVPWKHINFRGNIFFLNEWIVLDNFEHKDRESTGKKVYPSN